VPCSGVTAWSAAITPSGGVFVHSDAGAHVATLDVTPAHQATGVLKLFWSR
jgi:hypothetical protein